MFILLLIKSYIFNILTTQHEANLFYATNHECFYYKVDMFLFVPRNYDSFTFLFESVFLNSLGVL